MISNRTLRTSLSSIPAVPKQLTVPAPRPIALISELTPLSEHIIPAAGMIMDASLRARAERRTTSKGNPEALTAPFPVVLARGTGVAMREVVMVASDVDVSASSGASCVAVEAEHHAFVAPAPLVLAAGWIAVKRERIVAAAAVVVGTACLALPRASTPAESLALIAPSPIALPWGAAVVVRKSVVPAYGSVVLAAARTWSDFWVASVG